MIPTIGMLSTVRNRRGIISAGEPYEGHHGRLHLVTVGYADADGVPEDRLVWEREPNARQVPTAAVPQVEFSGPMPAVDFDALVRATRWSALTPYLELADPDRHARTQPIAAPFHSAVEVDDYQLAPLLLANDVGWASR